MGHCLIQKWPSVKMQTDLSTKSVQYYLHKSIYIFSFDTTRYTKKFVFIWAFSCKYLQKKVCTKKIKLGDFLLYM